MKKQQNHRPFHIFICVVMTILLFVMSGCSNNEKEVSLPEPQDNPSKTDTTLSLPEPQDNHNGTAAEERTEEPDTVELREFPAHEFVISECFYDGTTLRLAYKPEDMVYPVKFGFSPDDGVELYNIGRWYINAAWQDHMTSEDYAHVEKMLREEEQCGFILRYVYLGDHIRLIDGTDLGPWVDQKEDGTIIIKYSPETVDVPQNYGEVSQIQIAPLPPEALDRDALDLVLTIRDILEYHYKDGNNYYYGNETLGERTVTIRVPRQ